MILKRLEIAGFKSFARKIEFSFEVPITSIVGPNGSGKSNVAEALRWVLGEQSLKSLRGKRGEDLIFSGSQGAARLGRASVTIVFANEPLVAGDESSRPFSSVDFDEVALSREVHRDGTNQYSINGTAVRLKDIVETLAHVSLGPSGHHIISQGEADRILSANIRERKDILEEALGLKIYQFKRAESQKKLAKTRENMDQVESLRREIAPHLKYLRKQVEEIEKAKEMKEELKSLSTLYFGATIAAITRDSDELQASHTTAKNDLASIQTELEKAGALVGSEDKAGTEKQEQLLGIERSLGELARERDDLARRLGRLEGLLEVGGEEAALIENKSTGEKTCKYCGQAIKSETKELEERNKERQAAHARHISEKTEIENKLVAIQTQENGLRSQQAELKIAIEEETKSVREAERTQYDLRMKSSEARGRLEKLEMRLGTLAREKENIDRDVSEISVLVGVNLYNNFAVENDGSTARSEETRRRIERLRIKLEERGGGGEETLKEFEETTKRDEYLLAELEDLEKGAASLKQLMDELAETLENKFKEGLSKVNKEFNHFFSVLFGGGNASLKAEPIKARKKQILSEEELLEGIPEEEESENDEKEEFGIDIAVNLPRKRIKGLEMLSGGERALTSIALIFAMSQVNPPPFLVLDETDAALDEANSRRYGDMIVELAKKSQLILITHNRETMSRAGILYGVTMGADSISKVLSVKFEEAESYAK